MRSASCSHFRKDIIGLEVRNALLVKKNINRYIFLLQETGVI
jgi:hypothetical protein